MRSHLLDEKMLMITSALKKNVPGLTKSLKIVFADGEWAEKQAMTILARYIATFRRRRLLKKKKTFRK